MHEQDRTTKSAGVADADRSGRPSPALTVALAGWAGLERDACLQWLEHPQVPRAAVEDLLLTSFTDALTVMARHDEVTRTALSRLTATDLPRSG